VLTTLRPFYFSADVAPRFLVEAIKHLNAESPARSWISRCGCIGALPVANHRPLFVLGAEGDRICTPDDVPRDSVASSRDRDGSAGLAHMMMLERQWRTRQRRMAGWLQTLR
jgi:hypothetical protein